MSQDIDELIAELQLERADSARLRALHANLSRQLAETRHRVIALENAALATKATTTHLDVPTPESAQQRLDRWSRVLAAYDGRVADVSDALPVPLLPIDDGGR